MKARRHAAAYLASTVALAVLTVAGCASPPPPAPIPVAVVPPAAPPPPPVTLARPVLEAAAAYRLYMSRASEVSPAFANGMAVQQSVMTAAAYEPKQFLRGAIAYAALVALQSPQFVASVRTFAVDPTGRRELADRLLRDPNYVAALPSASNAAGLVGAALHADASKLRRTGELVKQAAYDVQRQSWSKADVVGRDARLAQAKVLSAQPLMAPEADVNLLATAVNGRDAAGVSVLGVDAEAIAPPYSTVITRGLALAALAALGEAGITNEAGLQGLLDEQSSAFCLNMSKLNLYQCLSVAKPYYEDVFCLGQHILLDTAQCMQKAAGPQPAATLASATPPGAAAVVSTRP